MRTDVAESFRPIAVRPPTENPALFRIRCFVDLQVLTVHRFLRERLRACQGRVLDVGAGEAPWRDLLKHADYVGVDVEEAKDFGMRQRSDIVYYDGNTLPFEAASFDHVLCTEVLEHVPDPARFLRDVNRVLRKGGTLILTVPWSARLHHTPHDYTRFTRYGLHPLLQSAGFSDIVIEERGNDIAVIANKLIVVTVRLLRPTKSINAIWTWPLAILLAPPALVSLVAAHAAMLLRLGSRDDPLGYGVVAVKAQDALPAC
jgi:SAM-dependent methyltransferase